MIEEKPDGLNSPSDLLSQQEMDEPAPEKIWAKGTRVAGKRHEQKEGGRKGGPEGEENAILQTSMEEYRKTFSFSKAEKISWTLM